VKFRLTTRDVPARAAADPVVIPSSRVKVRYRDMRVLDLDLENRPLSYLGSDFTTSEVTALAWAWSDDPENVTCYLLGETDPVDILTAFLDDYNRADVVTGHFIKGHDLPILNGALMEYGLPTLSDKRVCDTKLDLIPRKGLSMSQESLGAMFKLSQPKVQMNQVKWRSANRLTPEGRELARERVVGDVRQHIALRQKLIEHGYLRAPQIWRSSTARVERYEP
jgi:hypothetical protein